jgi:hypothetical protein
MTLHCVNKVTMLYIVFTLFQVLIIAFYLLNRIKKKSIVQTYIKNTSQ